MPVAKQARAEVSTRRLLDAARDLIAEVGYHRATLALIAQRAGYSHGLVTRRFGSKENLLYVLVERMTVTWAQREGRVRPGQGVGREAIETGSPPSVRSAPFTEEVPMSIPTSKPPQEPTFADARASM